MLDAIVAGHLCVDLIPEIDRATAESASFMEPGRLTESGRLTVSTGGAVSNTGISMHRLGLDVRLVARLGNDTTGFLARDLVAAHSRTLSEHLSFSEGEPSSYTLVISPPGIDRTFLHCPGTNNTFGPEDLSPELLSRARLLHFGYPTLMRRMFADGGGELAALLKRGRDAGATVSLDMAMPDPARPSGQADWQAICGRALPMVDLFVPSAEELLYMLRQERFLELADTVGQAGMLDALGCDEIVGLAEQALDLGARVVLLKLGHRGCYLRSREVPDDVGGALTPLVGQWRHKELWVPVYVAEVVTTTGAGDAAIAGFLGGILRGQSAGQALRSAAAVGACNVEAADATSGVRTWQETQARIQSGWAHRAMDCPARGWSWDEDGQVWIGPRDRH